MSKSIVLTASLTLLLAQSVAIIAAAPAGKAVKVSGSATTTGQNGHKTLSTGSEVFQGDVIKTGYTSNVQLLFSDQTKLVVGPRSEVKIDDYVLGDGNQVSALAIRAARGTFRFITGESKKSAYKISINKATIGIRGTELDFANRGKTSVVLYSGSIQVCIKNSCKTLKNKCDLAQTTNNQTFKSTTQQLVPNAYSVTFPYIRGESRLLPAFRVGASACDSGVGNGPKTDSGGGDNGDSGGSGNKK